MDEYFVYMVRCANGALYTGITTDVSRRLAEHNAAKGARYTRLHAPVELVWTEAHPDRSSATKREAQIKRLPRVKKLALIRRDGVRKPRKDPGSESPPRNRVSRKKSDHGKTPAGSRKEKRPRVRMRE